MVAEVQLHPQAVRQGGLAQAVNTSQMAVVRVVVDTWSLRAVTTTGCLSPFARPPRGELRLLQCTRRQPPRGASPLMLRRGLRVAVLHPLAPLPVGAVVYPLTGRPTATLHLTRPLNSHRPSHLPDGVRLVSSNSKYQSVQPHGSFVLTCNRRCVDAVHCLTMSHTHIAAFPLPHGAKQHTCCDRQASACRHGK